MLKTYAQNRVGMDNYWANSFIENDFSNFTMLLVQNINYFFFPIKTSFSVIILILVGMYILVRKNFNIGFMLLLILLIECFVSWLGFYPFRGRVILFLLPILLIFTSAPLEFLSVKNKLVNIIIIILMLIPFWGTINNAYFLLFKLHSFSRGYHPREMMAEMVKKIKPNDIILINQNSNTEFAYYSTEDGVGWIRPYGYFTYDKGLDFYYWWTEPNLADSIKQEGKAYLQTVFGEYMSIPR